MRSLWSAALILMATLVAPAQDDLEVLQQAPPPKGIDLGLTETSISVDDNNAAETTTDVPSDPYMEKLHEIMAAEDAAETEGTTTGTATPVPAEGGEGNDGFDVLPAALQGVMALCGTLALFLLLLAAFKRWGRRTPLLAGQSLGHVLGRIALSPQATLHFIRIKNEVLVVGVTQQSVRLLRTMEAELFDSEVEEESSAPQVSGAEPVDFLSQLQASQANLQRESSGFDEELDSLKGDLQRLKQFFQDSARARE